MQAETNAPWVPVAVASDVADGTVIPAALPSGPIAVWRSASGKLYANGDRCPHRGMRLSHGFVRGDSLSCIYHGWRYGTDGACEHIPAHPDVVPPKTINCGPLPVSEVNGVVWAAATRPANRPPDLPGYSALRSLTFTASAGAIARAGRGTPEDGALAVELGGHPTRLLFNASGPREVLVIVLVESQLPMAERLAVSNAVEALRRAAEAQETAA